jgi:hypothetical protein
MALQHDSIVPVLDVVDEAGDAFIATEYQEGATLEAALAGRRFSPQETNDILGQIARALDFAHDRALVHGDLKPSTVFVSRQGIKVADFGISPRAHWESGTPMPAGLTHPYLSPEHLSGAVSARSDQYSLAAIAYRMYTGHVPPVQTAGGPPTTRVDITPPSRIQSGLPGAIDEPILKALDRDPENRYESCRKFYGALGAALIAPEESRRGARGGIYAIAALILILAGVATAVRMLTAHKTKPVETAKVVQQPRSLPAAVWKSTSALPKTKAIADPGEKRPTPMPVAVAPRPVPVAPRPTVVAPPQAAPRAIAGNTPATISANSTAPAAPAVNRIVRIPDALPPALPAAPPPALPPAPPPASSPRNFTIEVFSRTHRIEEGSSFGFNDPELGELGQYDLKAVANADWPPAARGQFRLEWTIDGIPKDAATVTLAKLVQYRNEPTPGTYKVTLKLDGKPVQSFSFRITP